jgi:hypothetical protein
MSQIENIPELSTPEANIPEIEQGETGKDTMIDPSLDASGSTECNVCDMLETISAPGLSSSNYGKDIEDVFSNIDKNFKVVANHDFIKGENGDTIEVEYIKLNKIDEGIGKELYNALKSALFTGDPTETPKSVDSYNWDWDINNYIVPLVKIVNINKEEYISSATPILFIDYRFSSNVLASVPQDSYIDITNLSCIVNFKYSNNEWICEIDNSFPRIQYNTDKKYFEWLLNNNGTTICATGIKGDKGEKISMWSCEKDVQEIATEENGTKYLTVQQSKITGIDKSINIGDPIVVFLTSNGNYEGYIISYIKSVDKSNTYTIPYNDYINKLDFAKNTYEFFKSLNINNSNNEPAKGIFLPFNDAKKAHVIYSDNDKLNIKAVNSYEDFNSTQLSNTINIDTRDSTINMGSDINIYTSNYSVIGNNKSIKLKSNNVELIAINAKIKLNDSGKVNVEGNTDFKGNIGVSGSVSSSLGFYQTSDERLKEYKGDINIDLDKLLLLPKKYFTWKLDRNGKMEIGTSAQEVQKLYPELVSKDSEGKLVVAYDKLSIVALRAIDVLNSKNKELEARIERLEKLIK